MFQAGDVVETDFEGFLKLLRSKTRAFVSINDHEYYITHTDGYWRVQDCEALNDKGHFTDCSELVNTVCEVVELPWICWQEPARQLLGRHGLRGRRCVTANKTRYFLATAGAAPAPAVFFCRYVVMGRTSCTAALDDSQNSD